MKADSIKTLHNLRSLVNSWGDLDNNHREIINEAITTVFFCETPISKSKKFDYFKLVNKKHTYTALRGVYYDNGNVVASDGHILAIVKSDYDTEREGQIITSDGQVLEGYKYPNYKGVIPTTDGWPTYNIDFAKVRDIIKRSKVWAKANGCKQNCTNRLIKIGSACFSLKYFEVLISGMEHIGDNTLMIKDKITAALCKNDKGTLLLMPHIEPQDTEGVFIAELPA